MAASFEGVLVSSLSEDLESRKKIPYPVTLCIADEYENLSLSFRQSGSHIPDSLLEVSIFKDTDSSQLGSMSYIITKEKSTLLLKFPNENDLLRFGQIIDTFKKGKNSMFAIRTDESSAAQYFQFYGYLSQQQNMMQDYIRTSTYQRAILANLEDFKDKVVLDVGAGSGILSFFAAQAGARKVYAVEASSMAKHAETLVYHNKLSEKVEVIPGKIEEIGLPEQVDVIISEPMGYMLFNERMLETYLHAKKWLASNGKMFPSRGDLHIVPFSDAALYMEQLNKANFWYQQSFHGVDLASLRDAAVKEYFRQPIVDTFDINICMSKSLRYSVDFRTAQENDLHRIDVPLTFNMLQTGEIHGLAFWFDVAFFGSTQSIWLSTAPTQPLTHWYQVRCLLENPLFVQTGQTVTGRVVLNSNKRQSYDVDIELTIDGSNLCSRNTLDLKNPFFRYTGQPPQPPPGCNEVSPSESYWQTLDSQTAEPIENYAYDYNETEGYEEQIEPIENYAYDHNELKHDYDEMGDQIGNNATNLVVNGIIMNGDSVMETHPTAQNMQNNQVAQPTNIISIGGLSNSASSPNSRTSSRVQGSVPTSSIGGGISPSLFTQVAHGFDTTLCSIVSSPAFV